MFIKINDYKYIGREDLVMVLPAQAVRNSKDNRDLLKSFGLDILDESTKAYVLVQEEGDLAVYPSNFRVNYYR